MTRLRAWAVLIAGGLAWAWDAAHPVVGAVPQQGFVIELLIYAALFVLSDLLKPKPKLENAKPAGLGDFQFPTATEGRVVPLLWGRAVMAGPNVVWYGDLQQEAIVKHVKTSLFTSKKQIVGFKYHLGFQLAMCRGTIDGVRRAWVGETVVYDGGLATTSFDVDEPDLYGGDELGQGGVQATVEIFRGTVPQAASAYLGQFQDSGAGTLRTPGYTGTAYLVVRGLGTSGANPGGGYLGNSTSIQPWKFEIERYPGLFSGQTSGQNKVNSAVDCNPMNVIYEILTNVEWGFGFAAGDVDTGIVSTFKSASDVLISEGNGFSMILDRTMEAA